MSDNAGPVVAALMHASWEGAALAARAARAPEDVQRLCRALHELLGPQGYPTQSPALNEIITHAVVNGVSLLREEAEARTRRDEERRTTSRPRQQERKGAPLRVGIFEAAGLPAPKDT